MSSIVSLACRLLVLCVPEPVKALQSPDNQDDAIKMPERSALLSILSGRLPHYFQRLFFRTGCLMKQTHFSLLHRFLHWAIALGVLLALFTAFLNATWLNIPGIAQIIASSLAENGITVSSQDASSIARKIRTPMFDWHFYAGYALVALLILRWIDLFVSKPKFDLPCSKEATAHQKLRGGLYVLLYIALTLILAIGLFMKFGPRGDDVRELRAVLKAIHIYCGYFVGVYVFVHLAGVFIGENTTEKGIVSKMIHGGK
ncbi:MAG: cytochrome b/b6 domain-containing protein [Burkholderiales bacterium]|jgi:cytochrome b561|nr:cytochrome b/b6 domain-containing protein [Burkholderiales bacterium]